MRLQLLRIPAQDFVCWLPGILRRSLYEVWGFNIVFLFHFIYFLNFEWRRFGLVDLEGNSVAFFQYSRELVAMPTTSKLRGGAEGRYKSNRSRGGRGDVEVINLPTPMERSRYSTLVTVAFVWSVIENYSANRVSIVGRHDSRERSAVIFSFASDRPRSDLYP